MYANETGKSIETGYELSFSTVQQRALTNLAMNDNFDTNQVHTPVHRARHHEPNNPADAFQTKPAHVLTFDNPAHARRMA